VYNAFSAIVQIRKGDKLEQTIMTNVKLRPEQRQKLERWAQVCGQTKSDVVRLLIDSVELDRSPRFVAKHADEPTVVTLHR